MYEDKINLLLLRDQDSKIDKAETEKKIINTYLNKKTSRNKTN